MKKKEMKMLPINIVEGEITGISIECKNALPSVSINVSLIDDYGKKITTVVMTTKEYYTLGKMEVSMKSLSLIGDLIRELKNCAIQYMNQQKKIIDTK